MYAALLVVAALDAAGYSVIAPIVPEIAAETGAGPAVMGALVATFAAGMALGFVVAGWLLRRRTTRTVLLASLALGIVGSAGFVAGGGLPVYFPARFLLGLASGGLWIGVVFGVLERYASSAYQRLTGILAGYSVGAVAGPALGALGGVRWPFAALGALFAASLVLMAVGFRAGHGAAFGSDRRVLATRPFRLASAAVLLVALAFGVLDGPLPLHFATRLEQAEIGGLYVAGSLVVGASSVLAGRFEPRRPLAAAVVLLPLGIGLAGLGTSVWVWIVAMAVVALGVGLGEAGALGVLLEAAGPERIVLAMIVWSQLWAVGYLVGPAAGGALADVVGFGALGLVPLAGSLAVLPLLLRRPAAAAGARG